MPPKEGLGPLELDVLQYVGDHHPISVAPKLLSISPKPPAGPALLC